jgi:basic membrane lipoprotein Med (substrate-binding protein (PBP1-ABC) superfamily)
MVAYKAETDRVKVVSSSVQDAPEDKEFERRMKMSELALKEKELQIKRAQAVEDRQAEQLDKAIEREFMARMQNNEPKP